MAPPATLAPPDASLERFEEVLVDVFSELADLFGNPRSHGQIYGLLFASPDPLTMDAISDRLGISKGSTSQGLRALETLGAVERDNTQRTATYTARLELKLLISGFVRQRLLPRLDASQTLLADLPPLLDNLPRPQQAEYRLRLARVTKWHKRARQFLPIAQKFLKTD
jgi:DNA-binding transcriptional regulator GbsR (MarR family)